MWVWLGSSDTDVATCRIRKIVGQMRQNALRISDVLSGRGGEDV